MRQLTIKILLLGLGSALCAPVLAQFSNAPDTWWLCPADRVLPIRPQYAAPLESGSTEIRSDTTRIVKNSVTEFAGNVEIIRDSRSIAGDVVTYDDANSLFEVHGHATIWDAGLTWQGEHALFNMESDVGRLSDGNFWLNSGRGRGYAETVEADRRENISLLEGVDYTTCTAENPDWRFSANKIKLDHDAGRGSATHALLKIRDVPVFYFPYINFPLDNKRKSGFLIPTIGSSNESGFDIRTPYYFNLAPNQDATFTPRWMGDRGVMLGGQYRFLTEDHDGTLGVEFLPSDDRERNNARSLISFQHRSYFDGKRGFIRSNIQNVSDARYFEDFGRSLSVTSQRFLDRSINFRYRRPRQYRVTGIVQSYQQVDDSRRSGAGPYKRLPQIQIQTLLPSRHLTLTPQINAQTTYFDRTGSVSGTRLSVIPSVTYPFLKPYVKVIPKLAVRHTEYFIHDQGALNKHESVSVPIASVDSRLFAERTLNLFGTSILQTLEPRAYYLYIPKDGQDDLPIFDTGQFDLSFRNLFRENRFTGRDRVGDANQLTLAATTRLLSLNSGLEIVRASFGQVYYFENREINLPGRLTDKDGVSDFVGELATNLGNGWSARAVLQYDPNNSTTERASYGVHYRPSGTEVVANASYRRRRNIRRDVEQSDLSFRLPINNMLNLLGRWNYSFEKNRTLELVGGIELDSCCWGARLVGRRFIRNTAGEFDTGIFLQIEFKGLAGYGRGTDSFLRRSIPGYESYF